MESYLQLRDDVKISRGVDLCKKSQYQFYILSDLSIFHLVVSG